MGDKQVCGWCGAPLPEGEAVWRTRTKPACSRECAEAAYRAEVERQYAVEQAGAFEEPADQWRSRLRVPQCPSCGVSKIFGAIPDDRTIGDVRAVSPVSESLVAVEVKRRSRVWGDGFVRVFGPGVERGTFAAVAESDHTLSLRGEGVCNVAAGDTIVCMWAIPDDQCETAGERPSAKRATDTQVGGDHYRGFAIEPVTFIRANRVGFCAGNVIKYICRYPLKGGAEDLRKARHYLDMLIEDVEAEK